MKTHRILTSIASLALTGAMLFNGTSCGLTDSLTVNATSLSDGYERKSTASGEISEKFITAMSDFSMKLFKGLVTADDSNDFISPLSAVICLAMIANGADGETKSQMEAAFGMETDELNEALYAYTSSLYSADDCKCSLADSIWFRDEANRLHVNEEFLQINADWYNAQIYSAPFDETTLKDINNWCKKYTDGMIEKMIDEIPEVAVMYLINAVTFDAKWAEEYEGEDVNDGIFTGYDKTESDVSFLYSTESVLLSGDGVIGFAKDYIGNRYSLVGLLLDEKTDIYDYINSLDGETWMKLWNSRQNAIVNVRIPEFEYSTDMNLNATLQSMGMIDMFDGGLADFSALGYSEAGNISCSDVCQKAYIKIDRNGTKAAAITWGVMTDECLVEFDESYNVYLDRPFVFAIVDNATGLPVFIGAVTNL